MYRIIANRYYSTREYNSFADALKEYTRLAKMGSNVKILREDKVVKSNY